MISQSFWSRSYHHILTQGGGSGGSIQRWFLLFPQTWSWGAVPSPRDHTVSPR